MKLSGKTGIAGCKLTSNEMERYTRQIQLPDFGIETQQKLKSARALVIGAGGLGSPVLLYLAGAGVGTIGIVDDDRVSESNLQRQILYETSQIGLRKVLCAKARLELLNPIINFQIYDFRLTDDNATPLLTQYDIIIDCTDNLSTRYTIDRASQKTGKPFIHASVCEFQGQVSVFNYRGAPSYEDLFPYLPDNEKFTQPQGIIGAFVGIVAGIQAMEAINVLTNSESTLAGYLLLIDMKKHEFRKVRIS